MNFQDTSSAVGFGILLGIAIGVVLSAAIVWIAARALLSMQDARVKGAADTMFKQASADIALAAERVATSAVLTAVANYREAEYARVARFLKSIRDDAWANATPADAT